MFTFNERDLQRMPKPAKAHLPIRNDIDLSLIDDETGREHEVNFYCKECEHLSVQKRMIPTSIW